MTYTLVRVPKEPRTLKELAEGLYEALDCRGGAAMLYIQTALESAHALGVVETKPERYLGPHCNICGSLEHDYEQCDF